MKKLLAILLVLALLLPMGTVVHAEEVETKPFYMVNWSNYAGEYTNVFVMPSLWAANDGVSAAAESLKEKFDTYPDGARYVNFTMGNGTFRRYVEDACFMGKAVPVLQNWLEAFLSEYKRIGGKLDGLAFDVEYLNIYSYYIHDNYYTKDPLIYDKMVKNSEYQTKIRPQLVERGFKFYENVTEYTPEIYSIYPNSGSEYAVSRDIWDTVMRSYLGQCITEACEPLWEYYPDAVVSDYQSKNTKSWLMEVSDSGGILGSGGNQSKAGNSNNENFYFVRPYTSFFTDTSTTGPAYRTVPGYSSAVYEDTPFNHFLYDSILAKDTYLASDNGDVSWWIAHYLYSDTSNNAYYAETLFHLGMLNPQIFLGYIYKNEFAWDGDFENSLQVVDECMQELTRVVGAADRKPIYVDPNWNHQFVLSGMYAGGKNYWRLTPDTSKVSVEDFKVEGTDPTFCINGETVTFPQGKIIETGEIFEIGTCGYWIETPTDVTPVITRDSNYFREHPAFQETFESYEVGTEYTYNNALPEACWEVKKQGGGNGTVVADGDGKALAVTGIYTAKNVNMPENITAGDTYAENQAWEVSFTLPSDMAMDAELVLLNGTGVKKTSKDGGFKIVGGKVYYSQAGEYVELAGVELTAGTKYTVIRDMDFSVADAITCDYYVYGTDGSLLGKAMDIPVAAITLPVGGVSIGCTKVIGEAVLLDNYKLYPTSVAADYTLYDAATGMPVTETDKARQGDTAYRLSWLNTTQLEKSYSIVAAYYNGDTLVSEKVIQEVKMAPNGDGVLTGIVKNEAEGQAMLVYLRDDNAAEENDTTGGAADEPGIEPDSKLIIIIAAAAAVLITVIVIAVVASAKKKKKTGEEIANE